MLLMLTMKRRVNTHCYYCQGPIDHHPTHSIGSESDAGCNKLATKTNYSGLRSLNHIADITPNSCVACLGIVSGRLYLID